jgi:hypothetical protein
MRSTMASSLESTVIDESFDSAALVRNEAYSSIALAGREDQGKVLGCFAPLRHRAKLVKKHSYQEGYGHIPNPRKHQTVPQLVTHTEENR